MADDSTKPISELIAPLLEGLTMAPEPPDPDEPESKTPGEDRGLLPPSWGASRGVPGLFREQLYGETPPDETRPLTVVRRWLVASPRPRSLVLAGSVGTGKSYAGAWLVCAFVGSMNRDAPPAYFCAAEDYATAIRERDRTTKHRARFARVLVLDDLGDEYPDAQGFNAHTIKQLISGRHRDGLETITTTNLDRQQVAKRYGERIADRLSEGGAWIDCRGESLRQ